MRRSDNPLQGGAIMFRGGFCLIVCLAMGGICLGQEFYSPSQMPMRASYAYYSQPFLNQGIYDLTGVYSQYSAAVAEDQRAYSELNITIIRLQREFVHSAEFKAAMQEVDDAHDALDDARRPVLAAVAGDPHYQELAARHQTVDAELSRGGLPLRDVLDLAASKMGYGTEMRRMEAEALRNDPAVQSARTRLVSAQRKVDDMRERFEDTLYQNTRWATAKQSYDNAEIAVAAANGAVIGANTTACLAICADQRHTLYNYGFGADSYAYPIFDGSSYYGRRY
jgi:hypothetical protein